MSHSWIFGGLTGFAVLAAATGVPFMHRGANPSGSASANSNGVNGVLNHAATMQLNPLYRVPLGSPIPNPSKMPGHERPYLAANNAMYSGATNHGGLQRR
jgi:hypothetical protein